MRLLGVVAISYIFKSNVYVGRGFLQWIQYTRCHLNKQVVVVVHNTRTKTTFFWGARNKKPKKVFEHAIETPQVYDDVIASSVLDMMMMTSTLIICKSTQCSKIRKFLQIITNVGRARADGCTITSKVKIQRFFSFQNIFQFYVDF